MLKDEKVDIHTEFVTVLLVSIKALPTQRNQNQLLNSQKDRREAIGLPGAIPNKMFKQTDKIEIITTICYLNYLRHNYCIKITLRFLRFFL